MRCGVRNFIFSGDDFYKFVKRFSSHFPGVMSRSEMIMLPCCHRYKKIVAFMDLNMYQRDVMAVFVLESVV